MSLVTLGTSPLPIVDRNTGRKSFSVRNASVGGQIVYIDNVLPGGLTVGNAGHPLSVGESLHFLADFDGPDIKLPWSGIASGAGAILYYKEYAQGMEG